MQYVVILSLLFFFSSPSMAQRREPAPALAEMINAERAFAKLGQERGFRESFITYFADDGIGFGPHPYRMKETLSRQPPPASVPPIGFDWAPVFGDISQAGDLGWDTGPVLFKRGQNGGPPQHGLFFSVWKKPSGGVWRVVLDLGSDTPSAVAPLDAPFQSSFRPSEKAVKRVNVEQEIAALLAAEQAFLASARTDLSKAYLDRTSDEARVHRPDKMPIVGKDAVRRWLATQRTGLAGKPIKADVSSSGDLGYVYGSFELAGTNAEKGYYARVWKRNAKGEWQIVMDTISPLPAGTPLQPASPQH